MSVVDEEAQVYVLLDPRTQEVRYVGQTIHSLRARLEGHCTAQLRTKAPSRKEEWLAELRALGMQPLAKRVEWVPVGEALAAEARWINHYRDLGCNLTNRPPRRTDIVSMNVRLRGPFREKLDRLIREAREQHGLKVTRGDLVGVAFERLNLDEETLSDATIESMVVRMRAFQREFGPRWLWHER